ncbi:MAG: hypothetical protein GX039_06945 [Clostridia bacterium]|nr:hypothetical protein [Clostridia bacterium]
MPANILQVSVRETKDPKIVTAITAAIAACIDLQTGSWHITSIRPADNNVSRRWLLAGRQELISASQVLGRRCVAV